MQVLWFISMHQWDETFYSHNYIIHECTTLKFSSGASFRNQMALKRPVDCLSEIKEEQSGVELHFAVEGLSPIKKAISGENC